MSTSTNAERIDSETLTLFRLLTGRAVQIANRPQGAEILADLCTLAQHPAAFDALAPVVLRVVREKIDRVEEAISPPRHRRHRKAEVVSFPRV